MMNLVIRSIMIAGACIAGGIFFWTCEPKGYRREGERLYQKYCANCHLDNGQGLAGLIPPLAASDYLSAHTTSLPCLVRYGIEDTIQVNGRVFSEKMAGISALSDIHITNVLNYINTSWGNQGYIYQLEEVRELLKQCKK
jgi:mono/diheme cytochrome c family protein